MNYHPNDPHKMLKYDELPVEPAPAGLAVSLAGSVVIIGALIAFLVFS